MSHDYPYAERFGVNRTLPEKGRPRSEILAELQEMAKSEDASWESGKCSGTMYCGDHDHYGFMNEAFALYAHVNALQRDICPSQTRFEGEIIAMALDLFHAEAIQGTTPAGLVTSGGTGSICHAVLAYREHAAQTRGVTRPNVIKPETAHPAFDKACHLFGVELRKAPVDPKSTKVDLGWVRDHIDGETIALIGSACNYGYGTIDPIAELGQIAEERGVGLHVDGCLGGFILPFGQELGYDIPLFDFRVPGVTSISADTHKYGYALKGTSTLLFRDKALRNSQYFFLPDWSGGKYCSPGMDGSRSGGLLAATWASLVSLGREGYRGYAKEIFDTSAVMQAAVRSHGELEMVGDPTFLFSFRSDAFDVYHVNDFMRLRGWRFNGQQYPNALHMAVTRPQTHPGVAESFAADLDEAVTWANAQHAAGLPAKSSAIYGGVAGGMTDEADEFLRMVMGDMMDRHQSLPPVLA
ncbi:MAG: pyridoxal phosphate-dependent decarboxylase family protein [Acidimicrobiales bacterium]